MCGDLGIDTYCGGTTETTETEANLDYEAPNMPWLGKATSGAKGEVKVAVDAERGSRIAVTENGKTIARATATGGKQTIRFTARTGAHTYLVTATDQAGNTSDERQFQVTADADAPKVTNLQADPPGPADGAAVFGFITEPGATYTLAVRGQKTIRDTATAAQVTHQFWLRNGSYPATLTVTDPVGNTTTSKRTLKVAFDRPALSLTRSTPDNAASTSFDVTATPRSSGVVTIPGQDPLSFKVPDDGHTTIQAVLPDGIYPAGTVALTDFGGRRTTATVPAFTIDTAAPALTGSIDRARLREGLTRLALRTERGVTVALTAALLGDRDHTAAPVTAAMTAADGTVQWAPALPAGTYAITAIVTDAADNATTFTDEITVEDPLSGAEVALVLGALFLLLLFLAAAGLLVWVNRHRIAAWRSERAQRAAELARQRTIAQIRLAYEATVAQHRADMAAYRQAHIAWDTQRKHLADLVDIAENAKPKRVLHYGLVKLRAGERVYGTITATMVEQRSRQGQPALVAASDGKAAVTDTRIVFDGSKNREWSYAKLRGVTVTPDDVVLMDVTNRKSRSGVRASAHGLQWDRDHTLLMTALAEAADQRGALVDDLRRRRDEHERNRPTAPLAPVVPDVLRSSADAPARQ